MVSPRGPAHRMARPPVITEDAKRPSAGRQWHGALPVAEENMRSPMLAARRWAIALSVCATGPIRRRVRRSEQRTPREENMAQSSPLRTYEWVETRSSATRGKKEPEAGALILRRDGTLQKIRSIRRAQATRAVAVAGG